MKIFKLFFLLTLAITISSCGSDDDGPTVIDLSTASIAGTYEITFLEGSSETTTMASNGSEVVVERETFVSDTFTNAILTFNSNGTYQSSGSYRITYTLTVTGENPETESEIETIDDEGDYNVNATNNTLIIDGELFNIISFDGNSMALRGEDTDTFNGETTVTNTEIRLVKQS